ncbi:RHS repeat-associated core domain-containing protein, partial [uncultured Flavobacterium sp.]|uniref:RHS repeat domain-containing protein n=1 Tax=uncultured Flavobacterium sp. TaxID=165435 RepID=UPI0030CA1C24
MTQDHNKNIQLITYNHLNLPTKIDFVGGNNITYLYNAMGQKVEKKVIQGSNIINTDYMQGFQYERNVLQFFPHAEGYVEKKDNNYSYVFNYTDHLGNIRVSYSDIDGNGVLGNEHSVTCQTIVSHKGGVPVTICNDYYTSAILEENHYYPFGLKHKGYNNEVNGTEHKYKYQEQERQDELGLNWDSFKWRNYDYAIGRFMSIDPLAEKYAYNSTYAFQENKMGMGRELEGLELITFNQMRTYFTALKYAFIGKTEQARSNLKTSINNRVEVSITGKEKSNVQVANYNVNKVSDYGTMANSIKTISDEAKVATK